MIHTKVKKKLGLETVFIFERTNAKRETNYSSFFYGENSKKSLTNFPKTKIEIIQNVLSSIHFCIKTFIKIIKKLIKLTFKTAGKLVIFPK